MTIPAVVIDTPADDEAALKARFALAMMKQPQDLEGRFKAALSITPDTGQALMMANRWPNDPVVIAEVLRLTEGEAEGSLDHIGTKAELTRELLQRARAEYDGDIAHKFYKLYADVRGFVTKPDTNVNVQVNNNKVMIVKDLGTDADWEARAQKQQRALIDVSASKH